MLHSLKFDQALAGLSKNFIADLYEPERVQSEILQSILDQNKTTAFGRQHGFSEIKDSISFAQRVPISDFETLIPLINRIAEGEADILTTQAVIAFEETGGSSDGRKLIPYTAAGLKGFQHGLLPWLNNLCEHYPKLSEGRFYWAISPACRTQRVMPSGIPIGLHDAAYFGNEIGSAVADRLAVPVEAGAITDIDKWRNYTLEHLFGCEDLSLISVWSPSFLTELLRHAVLHREDIALKLTSNDQPHGITNKNIQRAELVFDELSRNEPNYHRIWPCLQVISCWDQASAAKSAEILRHMFPQALVQGKGLLATEGLVSIPLVGYSHPVISLRSGYFEFVDWNEKIQSIDQLKIGQEYRILMTTHSGLYRYDIGDNVLVRGFAKRTPTLEFIGRSNATSDMCGEKLSDAFVSKQLAPLGQTFAMLAPDVISGSDKHRYVLLLDAAAVSATASARMAMTVEQALHDNPQYAYARKLGQLDQVSPLLCKCPLVSWLSERQRQGQRLSDIKIPALLKDFQWKQWAHEYLHGQS